MYTICFGTSKMHDVYAYGIGLYPLIATILIMEFLIEKSRYFLDPQRGNIGRELRIGVTRLAKWTYLSLCVGILLPLLCGLCFDLYMVIPFKRLISPETKVETHSENNSLLKQ